MNKIKVRDDVYGVTALDGVPMVSSRKVAEIFDRRHDHVLRSIAEITDPKSGVSDRTKRTPRRGIFLVKSRGVNYGRWSHYVR